MMRLLPGDIAAAPSLQCPKCSGARCTECHWEGTREGHEWASADKLLELQLAGITDAHLSELAVTHAKEFAAQFRSANARYVVGLLCEVERRAHLAFQAEKEGK